MPKAQPVAIATATKPEQGARARTSPLRQQAPLLRNAIQRNTRERRARARQRVTPKQVGTSNVQPPRSNSGAARSTNRAHPVGRAKGFTHPGQQQHSRTDKVRQAEKASPKPVHRRRPIRPEGEHADIPSGRRSTSQRQPPPLTLPPPRQRPRHAYRGHRVQGGPPLKSAGQPLRSALLKAQRDKGPTSTIHRLPSGHRQTIRPANLQRGRNRRDPETIEPTTSSRKGKNAREKRQGAWVAHPRTGQIPPSATFSVARSQRTGQDSQETAPPT
ncbi:hypothetical protein WOLCODRAFT_154399 [Wolfiporia cocos MD-104 SS10]|uniref:Uncharacterized protein n=1 Tax=Wolfiporia cocos (strain MD-104) TaxID=742152 RepID=A0A2H3K2J3_WOLCO|nr:hypothetical protein WOLCODRAFT_154399 [Wolfiporia cocos MD-104 SS10]